MAFYDCVRTLLKSPFGLKKAKHLFLCFVYHFCQMLLNHGGDVNCRDFDGRVPVMYAAMNGQAGALGVCAAVQLYTLN